MNEQILKKTTVTIEVSASGEKYVNAVSQLFTEMREQVYKNLDGKPLINLKAEEVYFDSIDVEKRTEHFLFIFWPRERRNYTIKARIMVVIEYLDLKEEDIK